MRIFLDSSNLDEIKDIQKLGILDGVTTNPSSMALAKKNYNNFNNYLEDLLEFKVPISIQVLEKDFENMLKEAKRLTSMSSHVVIKLPMSEKSIQLTSILSQEGILINMTLCFSFFQAVLARNAGARYISIFMGRLDDINGNGEEVIQEVSEAFSLSKDNERKSLILAASIRSSKHFFEAFRSGADVVTLPYKLLKNLFHHPLTEKGKDLFLKDWNSSFLTDSYFDK